MYKGNRILGLIPARGGSKGLPRKNVLPFNGRPLICYTIEAALKAESVGRIVVSTEDDEIAGIAIKCGAEVPFMRPVELAQDESRAIDSYIYTMDRLNEEYDEKYEEFVVLQPTSPLRTSEDINNAISTFREKNADSVISVCEAAHPPEWARRVDAGGVLRPYGKDKPESLNRQEYPVAYYPNGAVYVFKLRLLKDKGAYYSDRTYPYVMSAARSVDIDTELDFKIAEILMREQHGNR